LRDNGASGLIARAGKGGKLDEKCSLFLAAADRAEMLPGVYYRVQRHTDPVVQADQFVNRARTLARSRTWNASSLLLCGDYDGDLSLAAILRFMDRVESRTGVVPVAYLENSQQLKLQMRSADRSTRARLQRAPYWLALYSHESGAGPVFPAPGNPQGLVRQYGLWPGWTMWQYGGVDWERGRSRPKVYSTASAPTSATSTARSSATSSTDPTPPSRASGRSTASPSGNGARIVGRGRELFCCKKPFLQRPGPPSPLARPHHARLG